MRNRPEYTPSGEDCDALAESWGDFTGPEGRKNSGDEAFGGRDRRVWSDPGDNADWGDFEDHGFPSATDRLPESRRRGGRGLVLPALAMLLALLLGSGALWTLHRARASAAQMPVSDPTIQAAPRQSPAPTLPPTPAATLPPTPAATPVPTPVQTRQPVDTQSERGYYRAALSLEEQAVYDAICRAVEGQAEKTGELRLPTEDRIYQIYDLVLRDRPEYFWVDGASSITYHRDGDDFLVTFSPGYTMDRQQRDALQRDLDRVGEEIRQRFGGASDYEKVKGVYEYLIDSSVYGTDPLDYSMCGVLVHHRGVCSSYARATQYLLQQLGIQTLLVSGTGGGESHAWNIVQVDGDWYQLDTTWGDPVTEDGTQVKSFLYFCLTDEEMLRDHSLEEGRGYPSCTATAANWYRHEGRWMEQYDEQWLLALIQRDLAQGQEVRFRCSDEQLYRQLVRELFEQGGLFSLLEKLGMRFEHTQYSTDDRFQTISFTVS